MTFDEFLPAQLLEVMLINAIAPFVLTAKILPLMQVSYRCVEACRFALRGLRLSFTQAQSMIENV